MVNVPTLKYTFAAKSLQLASLNVATRRLYRVIGNLKNSIKNRKGDIKLQHRGTVPELTNPIRKYQMFKPGMRVLDLGSGWVHWYSLVLRSQFDCSIFLYDVWDNRSFEQFRNYCRQLSDPAVRKLLRYEGEPIPGVLERLIAAENFPDAYKAAGFEYMVDNSGLLRGVEDRQFDLVVSNTVFEHLKYEDLDTIIKRTYEVLKPGGWAIHLVSLQDHLQIYAKGAHLKEFLKYSHEHYTNTFQNELQYINLVQIPEWLEIFARAGFENVETVRYRMSDLSKIEVHPSWKSIPDEDLACAGVQFVVRRPLES